MTPTDLKTKLTADATRLEQDIVQLRRQLEKCHMLLLKTQGALEALALLEPLPDKYKEESHATQETESPGTSGHPDSKDS